MERSAIRPHVSWSGPQPDREIDAYLLAMLLRIHASGLDFKDETKRDALQSPSVLTTANLKTIAILYAFYRQHMAERGVRNTEAMLKLLKELAGECVTKWLPDNQAAVRTAEEELLEYVDSASCRGFSAFG